MTRLKFLNLENSNTENPKILKERGYINDVYNILKGH